MTTITVTASATSRASQQRAPGSPAVRTDLTFPAWWSVHRGRLRSGPPNWWGGMG
jgi:hypothetical protein